MSAHRKIRILYVNHTGLVSGAEKVLLEILRGLNRERFEPMAICPAEGGLAEEIVRLRVDCHRCPHRAPGFPGGQIARSWASAGSVKNG